MKAPADSKQDTDLNWLLPLGVLALVGVLSWRFVGNAAGLGLDNDRSAQAVQFGLAVGAFALIAWGGWLSMEGRPNFLQVARDRTLLAIGLCAALGYFNFGHLHFGNFVHVWDTYHYYMGAKYFPELSYERLYDCAAVADAESGRREEVLRRTMTDLRTNVIVRTEDVLDHPERCKSHFSPERWEAFKHDINAFRSFVNEGRWREIHLDHGYNATPVWTLAGYTLSNLTTASQLSLVLLNLIDPLYWLATALIIWWAFGPRAFAVAMLVMGTHFPNRFYWTGGAFLRHDWIFYLVASICLLKKEHYKLAGAAFAYTTLLRLFPGLTALGPALGALVYWQRNKKLDPAFVQFVGSGLTTAVLLVGLTFATLGGPSTWELFVQNTKKHANTPLTNHMGLRTVLSWRPSTIGQQTVESGSIDNWAKWKSTRLEKWHEALPVFVLTMLGALVLIYFALQNAGTELWVAAAMGTGLIAFGVELTNYYYCFLMGLAVLHAKRREVGLLISALCATSLFLEWHSLAGMSGWLDEQYVSMSLAALFAIVGVWWSFTRWGAARAFEPEPELVMATASPAPSAPEPKSRKKKRS